MAEDPIVVVGGGLAAARLAAEYRASGGEADVTILSADLDPPYHRPPLTKGFLRGEQDRESTFVRPRAEYEEEVVDLRLEATVERIDPAAHEVELAGGERVGYGKLVLATGARPRPLQVPGADRVGVHTYRTLADAESVSAAAAEAQAAIVIGGSFIGYLAIVGVGVVPNVELAEDAGAEVDDGIVVDERFRTSLPDVYAIGDVARYPDPTSGRLRRIEHWSSANAQGEHLGRQLAGSRRAYDVLPVFFTQLFDRKLQVLGDVAQATECVMRGSLADGRLIGFQLTGDGRLVGAIVHGQTADVATELEELIRSQAVVDDPARLLDENVRPAEAVVA